MRGKTGAARVPIDQERLCELISASKMTLAELAKKSGVSARTIGGWRDSAGRADLECLRCVAEVLGSTVEYVSGEEIPHLLDSPDGEPVRNLQGTWRMTGQDLVVPGFFEYLCEPKSWSGRIVLLQDQRQVSGVGFDKDNDTIKFNGELRLNSMIRGDYEICSDRLVIFGVIFVNYLMDGKTMIGGYLGHETGHRSGSIFGSLRMVLESDSTEPLSPD